MKVLTHLENLSWLHFSCVFTRKKRKCLFTAMLNIRHRLIYSGLTPLTYENLLSDRAYVLCILIDRW